MDPIIKHIIDSKVVLAPLSGVSDLAFRLMTRKYGCPFAFTEMIDTNAIFYSSEKTFRMLDTVPADRPVGVQLVGSDAGRLLKAALICQEKGFQVVDINAACPAKKVMKKDKGGILMKDPKRLALMVGTLVKGLDIPVTVKLRAGWDPGNKTAPECARVAEAEGAAAVFIHPRYISQKYKGKPHLDIIGEIKSELSVPVIASGDIFGPVEAKTVLDETGCDALAVARGSFGRPWIFREIVEFLEKGVLVPSPLFDEVKSALYEHAELSLKFKGERLSLMKMYKHINWYLTGYPHRNSVMEGYSKKVKDSKALLGLISALEPAEMPAKGRYGS